MTQKNRSELKELFKTGAKPSQQDFADFIESTLNVKNDGIEKPSGANTPLKITAQDTDEKLLDFYAGETKTWSINQKPGENKIGLNISNAGGSKLFIDSSNGNVGLSIDQPTAKLHIQQTGNEDALRIDDQLKDTTPFLINKDGNVGIGTTNPSVKLEVSGDLKVTSNITGNINAVNINSGILSVERIPNLSADKITSGILSVERIPNLSADKITSGTLTVERIPNLSADKITSGTISGKLTILNSVFIGGYDKVTGNNNALNVTASTDDPAFSIENKGTGDGIIAIANSTVSAAVFIENKGTKPAIMAFANTTDNAVYIQNQGTGNAIRAVAPTDAFAAKLEGKVYISGNVGIGTDNPSAKLEVNGDLKVTGAITPSAGNSENNGIMFPKDPGGGSNDAAWIRYYSRNPDSTDDPVAKEETTFEIRTSNDITDHIVLMPSGNVGIGTTNPSTKLEVSGDLKVSGSLTLQGELIGNATLPGKTNGTGGIIREMDGIAKIAFDYLGNDQIQVYFDVGQGFKPAKIV